MLIQNCKNLNTHARRALSAGALLLLVPAPFLSAQQAINEAQHAALPLLGKEITFSRYQAGSSSRPIPFDVRANPGVWHDVRLVEWNPPWVTMSGYRASNSFMESLRVHLQSFPPALRSKVPENANAAQQVLADDSLKDAMRLSDGRILRKAVIVQTNPKGALIAHEQGEEFFSVKVLPASYFRTLRMGGPFIYLNELTLRYGTRFSRARLVAPDVSHCRIAHEAGTLTVPITELPDVAKSLVEEHLIQSGIFANEIVTDPALRKRSAAKSSRPTPKPVLPEPTRVVTLQKISRGHYAVLPLEDGTILTDVWVTGLNVGGVQVFSGGASRSIFFANLPAEVREEAGDSLVSIFQELFHHGIVALRRSSLYELVGDASPSSDLSEVAKTASGGRLIGHVGTGFLALEARWRDRGGAAVQFLKPITGIRRAFVSEENFSHLGNQGWRKWWLGDRQDFLPDFIPTTRDGFFPLTVLPLSKETVLLDPFEGRSTLFNNRQGVMKRAWKLSLSKPDQLAIVETDSGFYLGFAVENQNLAESQMSWPQLVADQSGRHILAKTDVKIVQKEITLFRLDADAGLPADQSPAEAVEALRIRPIHYRRLVELGMNGLTVALQSSSTDGFEAATLKDQRVDHSHEKEVVVDRVNVQFATETPSVVVFNVEVQQRERLVSRTRDKNGVVSVEKEPWKSSRIDKPCELEKDADGGIRFTDGRKIYELLPQKVGGLQLVTYEIKANSLKSGP